MSLTVEQSLSHNKIKESRFDSLFLIILFKYRIDNYIFDNRDLPYFCGNSVRPPFKCFI